MDSSVSSASTSYALGILTNVQADQPQADKALTRRKVSSRGPVGNQRHAVFPTGFSLYRADADHPGLLQDGRRRRHIFRLTSFANAQSRVA